MYIMTVKMVAVTIALHEVKQSPCSFFNFLKLAQNKLNW